MVWIPLARIDRTDTQTDFSLGPLPPALVDSVRTLGITHPLTVTPAGEKYRIVSGHRRVHAAEAVGLAELPVRVTDPDLSEEARLRFNLAENRPHRTYTDAEKARILSRFAQAGVSPDRVIEQALPLLGLERSRKIHQDLLAVAAFPPRLLQLMHDAGVPVRVFAGPRRWNRDSLQALQLVFSILKPGVNKWRELLELIEEAAGVESVSVPALLQREAVHSVLHRDELSPPDKYARIHQTLTQWRSPHLTALKARMARLLDRLDLDPRTRLKYLDTFESGELRLELRFRDRAALVAQIQKLEPAARSPAMEELLRLFREREG